MTEEIDIQSRRTIAFVDDEIAKRLWIMKVDMKKPVAELVNNILKENLEKPEVIEKLRQSNERFYIEGKRKITIYLDDDVKKKLYLLKLELRKPVLQIIYEVLNIALR